MNATVLSTALFENYKNYFAQGLREGASPREIMSFVDYVKREAENDPNFFEDDLTDEEKEALLKSLIEEAKKREFDVVKIVVDKNDYEVDSNSDGLSGIIHKKTWKTVLGGDSANTDDYDREYFEEVYEKWNGVLYDEIDRYGFQIRPNFTDADYKNIIEVDAEDIDL